MQLVEPRTKVEWEEPTVPFGMFGTKRRAKVATDIELPIDDLNGEKVEHQVKVGDMVVQVIQSEQAQ